MAEDGWHHGSEDSPLRLHLDELSHSKTEVLNPSNAYTYRGYYLNEDEMRAIYNRLNREFNQHDKDYEIIDSLMKKFHEQLAR